MTVGFVPKFKYLQQSKKQISTIFVQLYYCVYVSSWLTFFLEKKFLSLKPGFHEPQLPVVKIVRLLYSLVVEQRC